MRHMTLKLRSLYRTGCPIRKGTEMAVPMEHPGQDTFEKAPHTLMAQVRAGTLTAGDMFAYLTIAQLSYERGGEVNMAQSDFALAVGCKPRMLRYHLTALETHGWIAARKIGLGRICAYRPTSPTGAPQPSGNILPLDRPRPSGKRQQNAVQVATGLPFKRQNIATVNRQTPDRPVKTGIPESGDGVVVPRARARETSTSAVSLDGPPRPAPKPQPLPAVVTPDPPPLPPPPRAKRAPVEPVRPRTEPPETLEPTPSLRTWALDHGYSEQTLADEIERCLDKARVNTTLSGNWQSSLRIWVKNEVAYAAEDGRQPGVHAMKARPKTPARRDGELPHRPGQMIGQVTGWPGAGYSEQALEAARDPKWMLPIRRDEEATT